MDNHPGHAHELGVAHAEGGGVVVAARQRPHRAHRLAAPDLRAQEEMWVTITS